MTVHPAPCPGPDAHVTWRGTPSCTGHVKASNPERADQRGMPCGNDPAKGSHVCRFHGAGTPNARKANQRRQQQQAAERAVATLGLARDISPTDALLEEVRWTAGHVAWLRERVQEFETDQLTWGVTSEVHKGASEFPGTDTTEQAGPPVFYELYARERAHLVKVCAEAIKAGIEERRVRLAESQGALVADVIRRILIDLRLSPAQQTLVGEVVPRHLRAIVAAGGGV